MQYAKACIKLGYDYFEAKLLQLDVGFKAAFIFNTSLTAPQSTPYIVSTFLTLLDGLRSKLPTYLAMAEDTADEIDFLVWWEQHAKKLPSWASACQKVLLCQPSSACVERVFSLLKQYNDQQQSSLEDYIETALMMQYNR